MKEAKVTIVYRMLFWVAVIGFIKARAEIGGSFMYGFSYVLFTVAAGLAIAMLYAHYITREGKWWVIVEKSNGRNYAVGPYKNDNVAAKAMESDLLIESLCDEDAVDCYTKEFPRGVPLDEYTRITKKETHIYG